MVNVNANSINPAILTEWSAIHRRIADSPAALYAEQVTTQLANEISNLDEHEAAIGLAFRVDAIIARFSVDDYFARKDEQRGTEHLVELKLQAQQAKRARRAKQDALWATQQKSIVGDTLLIKVEHPDGHVVWKVPAADTEFVKSVLPVFAKRLPDLELPEAGELRRLRNNLQRNRWRLTKERRAELEVQIDDAKARLTRAQSRTPITRYAIFTTISGRDVGVHRLYVRCDDDEKVSAFDGDLTNFCTVRAKCAVTKNFGYTQKQLDDPEFMSRHEDKAVPNLYIISSDGNMSHGRMQSDFEQDGIVLRLDDPDYVEGSSTPMLPNADLGTRAGVFGSIRDAGKYRPLTAQEDGIDFTEYKAPVSVQAKRAAEALALMFGDK
jgi:hypothetical protein